MNNQKHEFALHVPHFSTLTKRSGDIISLDDQAFVHRIANILRLHAGETVRLFDGEKNALFKIQNIDKKKIVGEVQQLGKNQEIKPFITVILPLLKKEALAESIYSCVELGIQEIQFVATAKTQRSSLSEKELEHLKKIAISAAEQSKNFTLPIMHATRRLGELLQESDKEKNKIFFDPSGNPAQDVVDSTRSAVHFTIMIGPEGDLMQEEKRLLEQHGFLFCALTPTILRAQQALVVGTGLMRSLCKS